LSLLAFTSIAHRRIFVGPACEKHTCATSQQFCCKHRRYQEKQKQVVLLKRSSVFAQPGKLLRRPPSVADAPRRAVGVLSTTVKEGDTNRIRAPHAPGREPLFAYFLLAWIKSKASGGTRPAGVDLEWSNNSHRLGEGESESKIRAAFAGFISRGEEMTMPVMQQSKSKPNGGAGDMTPRRKLYVPIVCLTGKLTTLIAI